MTELGKDRLVGVIALVALAIIFLPMIFDGAGYQNPEPTTVDYALPAAPVTPQKPRLEIEPTPVQRTQIEKEIPKPVVPVESELESKDALQPYKPAKPIRFDEKTKTPTENRKAWLVQVASFTEKNQALELQNKIRKQIRAEAYIEKITTERDYFRVLVGPYGLKTKAESVLAEIESAFKLKGLIKPK